MTTEYTLKPLNINYEDNTPTSFELEGELYEIEMPTIQGICESCNDVTIANVSEVIGEFDPNDPDHVGIDMVYKCESCHGEHGHIEGIISADN